MKSEHTHITEEGTEILAGFSYTRFLFLLSDSPHEMLGHISKDTLLFLLLLADANLEPDYQSARIRQNEIDALYDKVKILFASVTFQQAHAELQAYHQLMNEYQKNILAQSDS